MSCLLFACVVATGPGMNQAVSGQVPDLPGWELLWQDEFDGTSLDSSRWEALNRRDSHNNELQYYLDDQVSVANGLLTLTATDQPLDGKQYRSGLVRTWDEQTYGRWEVRANLPTTQGMWPAIWLLPRTTDWPLGGEIDIMENRGNNPYMTSSAYHWNTTAGTSQYVFHEYTATEGGQPVNFHESYHNYAVEWEANQIRYYVDDNLHFSVDYPQAPQIVPMSLIINLAVGGWFGGDPDATTVFPQTFDIEYVRYWERDGDIPTPPPPTELSNTGFEDAGGSLADWTTFGNVIGNVSSASEASLDGSHALKLYGQFNSPDNLSGAYQGVAVVPGAVVTADASAFIRSQDTLSGKNNDVYMKLQYYSEYGAALGSAAYLGETSILIADGTTAEDTWLAHQIIDTAPDGAEEVRLLFVFHQQDTHNGAIHIDAVSLDVNLIGDINGDGFVGLDDLDLVLGAWNSSVTPGSVIDLSGDGYVGLDDLDIVLENWNSGVAPTPAASIPEPGTWALFMMAAWARLRRRTDR